MTEVRTCQKCGHQGAGRFCPMCGFQMGMVVETTGAEIDVIQPAVPVKQARPAQPTVAPTQVQPGGVMGQTEGVAFTDKVHDVLGQAREALVWQGSPSLALLVGLILRYAFLMGLAAFAFSALATAPGASPIPADIPALVFMVLGGLGCLQLVLRFFKLRATRYRISTERIEVSTGVLSRATDTYEAHQATDIAIRRPFPISFLGASNLEIRGKGWYIRVLGVPAQHAEAIRDAVRESGRREGARPDLIQWR